MSVKKVAQTQPKPRVKHLSLVYATKSAVIYLYISHSGQLSQYLTSSYMYLSGNLYFGDGDLQIKVTTANY